MIRASMVAGRRSWRAAALTLSIAAGTRAQTPAAAPLPQAPAAPPARWLGLIGEYDTPAGMRLVLEDGGRLFVADTVRHAAPLTERAADRFSLSRVNAEHVLGIAGDELRFERGDGGIATAALIAGTRLARRDIEPRPGTNQLRITPVRSVEELRREVMTQSPPVETGTFKPADLVELTSLDSTIRLEIRYATTNNFLGTKFYDEARAFMQRPAAEAVVRANRALRAEGFGLLIHDAYRPWFVTKMFWDATPEDKRWLVANPARGSLHNRGAAVDLTLFDLATGQPVSMPSTYDESTDRAFADYPGGTSRQRWFRAVLRRAMEAQGFTVNPNEWWHFDYKDWRDYAIGNVAFDKLRPARGGPRLRIIGTNDFHGAIEPRADSRGVAWGGAVPMAAAIRQARAECVAPACYSVLLDAGDQFAGQAPSVLAHGKPVVEMFNAMGYDAAALGNHDLDWGRDTLARRRAEAHYSMLSANARDVAGRAVRWISPDTILKRGPFVIGVIGIMTLEAQTAVAAANLAGFHFVDPVPIVDSLASDLRARGANVVVLVAHSGGGCSASGGEPCHGEIFDDARRLTQHVDVILAGHSHKLINSTVNGVPIVSAQTAGQAIDVVDLDGDGSVARANVRMVYADSLPADSAIARMVTRAVAAVGPRMAEPVATIGEDIPRSGPDYAVGRLVADAMRAAGHADFAATNHGGIRAPLHAGVATYGALFDIQPFGNRLELITASGAAMRGYFEALAKGRRVDASISGAVVTVDTTRPPGARVVRVELPGGRTLDDRSTYTLVISDFMAGGGDNMAFPDAHAAKRELPGTDLDATIAYLRAAPSPVRAPAAKWIVMPAAAP